VQKKVSPTTADRSVTSSNATKEDNKTTPTDPAEKMTPAEAGAITKLSDSEIIAKMSWEAVFLNVDTGKLFTGFSPSTAFVFTSALIVVADGLIPEEIKKTLVEADFNRIYATTEFRKKAFDQKSKLSLTVDPTFFGVSELPAADVSDDPLNPMRVFFITTLKAGTTSVELTLEGKKKSLATTVSAYTAQQLNDGRARYTTAVAGATPSPSCQSCHGVAGGANHSPTYLARFGDAAVLSTIETGLNPEDGYKTSVAHKMTFATPAQRAGITAYLRSLAPAP
jgi:mono/diheme cytochrome c family protein